ncbi:unnamed protein product [Calypogeia fissa]
MFSQTLADHCTATAVPSSCSPFDTNCDSKYSSLQVAVLRWQHLRTMWNNLYIRYEVRNGFEDFRVDEIKHWGQDRAILDS